MYRDDFAKVTAWQADCHSFLDDTKYFGSLTICSHIPKSR